MKRCCCARRASARSLPYSDMGVQRRRSAVRRADRQRHRHFRRSLAGIDGVAAAARRLGKTARVHVKVDSGFGRNASRPPVSTRRSPNWCRSPRKACCTSSASGAIWRSPTHRTFRNSLPPPTCRSKRSRTSPVVWSGRHSAGNPPPRQHRGDAVPSGNPLRTDPSGHRPVRLRSRSGHGHAVHV